LAWELGEARVRQDRKTPWPLNQRKERSKVSEVLPQDTR